MRAFERKVSLLTLEEVLEFAVRHVRYYGRFRGYNSLRDFPILTKETIRRDLESLLSDDLEKREWHYETSGGSTGEPVRFVHDSDYLRRTRSATFETKLWAGYRPGDRLLKLWGNRNATIPSKGLKAAVGKWLSNTILLDTFSLDEDIMEQYIQVIRRFSPRLIVGFASSLYEISKHILACGTRIGNVGAMTSTAGTLFPEMRQAMESAFECKVFNRYGSREVSIIAAEDGRGLGLRVAPTVHVETLRPDGSPCAQGEVGEIVVTSLANLAMPLIRFQIGDVGAIRIHDGKVYLEQLLGRSVELFKTRSGRRIDGQYFAQCMYFRDWLKTFRFRQTAFDHLVIEAVLASEPPPDDLLEIESRVKRLMGSKIALEWHFVDDIKPLSSGKYLYTVCEIT